MKHNTEKYKALIWKESYISINNNERDTGFLTKENIKEQKVTGLKITKIIQRKNCNTFNIQTNLIQ
jgi:uncharacterized linocin/CFP29 family protein